MSQNTIPVLLLTGYLGSGKTTLVNHILANERGIKFAVIVNDIGEVNIDADLIQKGGIVDQADDSLVALQNGCICCTLKVDLMKQIEDIVSTHNFDYIVIEASGICEPEPIAQTLVTMQHSSQQDFGFEICRLDCITTVVDALRLQSEFANGAALTKQHDEEDLENLIIQQIEFCNVILLNKASEVSAEELTEIKQIIKAIQPNAKIIETDYAKVELTELLNTHLFDFAKTSLSATWVQEFEREVTKEEEDDAHHFHEHEHEHEHHEHDHHHHHDGGEVEEYGISTFVYYRRDAFDMAKFENFALRQLDHSVIRTKGICYFQQNPDMSYMFEQAGIQKKLVESGLWLCTAPPDELDAMIANDPSILKDWDIVYGDKMQKIVFIGKNMNKEVIIKNLDDCLVRK
ncbi:MAG: GTP-binding protein [Bacteroidales bacterium]|nr:GTP-binding protein [Bacteroidales bacterium]